MDTVPESPEKRYAYTWTPEDKANIAPLVEATKTLDRESIIRAAHAFAVKHLGVPPDDLDQLRELPSWVTNKEMHTQLDRFEGTFILVLPKSSLKTVSPTTGFLIDFFSVNHVPRGNLDKTRWFKVDYDQTGTRGANEIVRDYQGVLPEDQDAPDNPRLN